MLTWRVHYAPLAAGLPTGTQETTTAFLWPCPSDDEPRSSVDEPRRKKSVSAPNARPSCLVGQALPYMTFT
jgi:hypothetical protein